MSDLTKQSELKELVKRIEPPEFVSGDTPLIVKAVDLRNAAYVIRNYCDALRSPASAGVREALRFVAESGKFQCFDDEAWDIVNSALSDHGVQESAGVEAGWRSIESAPRDGTGILVKLPDSDMPHTAKFWRGSWTVAWDHSKLKGWDAPTHWMPLPELPSDALLSKTLTEGEKKRPQIETPPANEGSQPSLTTDADLLALLDRAHNHVMTPNERYEQRRSFLRGMCPSHRDYADWCAQVDKHVPPLADAVSRTETTGGAV